MLVNNIEEKIRVLFNNRPVPDRKVFIADPKEIPVVQADNTLVVLSYRMNDAGFINKNLEAINISLNEGEFLVGCFETFTARRNRKKAYKIPVLRTVTLLWEFVIHRVLPRLSGLNRIYFFFSKGRDRLLSKAEMLGRLVCTGFEIITYQSFDGLIWFLAQKKSLPAYDQNASYGPVFSMPRIGKNEKTIYVYKFRTMHPYSEYLQDYIIRQNGYSNKGKPAGDFRITPWGKLLRKYWLDELPQLINLLKGDLKLVGVRPVGERYYRDIPEELRNLRKSQKPGCIPPYVALNMPSDVSSVQEAERIYLNDIQNAPYTTDFRYFVRALYNIVFRKKRSA